MSLSATCYSYLSAFFSFFLLLYSLSCDDVDRIRRIESDYNCTPHPTVSSLLTHATTTNSFAFPFNYHHHRHPLLTFPSQDRNTPLHFAAMQRGASDIFKLLVARGADLNFKNKVTNITKCCVTEHCALVYSVRLCCVVLRLCFIHIQVILSK
jgi:ankyrin repeat protein